MPLEVRWRAGQIEIEPAALPMKLVRRGRWLVAVPETEVGRLTEEIVEATREELQLERGQ
jgi:hypothetical protein